MAYDRSSTHPNRLVAELLPTDRTADPTAEQLERVLVTTSADLSSFTLPNTFLVSVVNQAGGYEDYAYDAFVTATGSGILEDAAGRKFVRVASYQGPYVRLFAELATATTQALDVSFVRSHIFTVHLATAVTDAPDVSLLIGVTLPVDLATITVDAPDVTLLLSTLDVALATVTTDALDVTFALLGGEDLILTSGDMQSGADLLALSGDEVGGFLAVTYPQITFAIDLATVSTDAPDATLFVLEPLIPSGDMQSGGDEMIFSGDEAPGTVLTRS